MSRLFSNRDLSDHYRTQEVSMLAELDRYGEDEILNLSADELSEYCEKRYSFERIVLREADRNLKHTEATLHYSPQQGRHPASTPGTLVAVDIPFEGPTTLLVCTPSTQTSIQPEAEILNNVGDEGVLRLTYSMLPGSDAQILKATIERDIKNLRFWVDNVNRDVEAFNRSLRKKAREHVEARKARLLRAREQIAALDIPLARRANAPKTYAVPEVRRRIAIAKPKAPTEKFTPEPTLADTEYENILGIVSLMARVIECSPKVLATLDEEALRTLFLVQLNAQYEGRATGETFNSTGKTDILIQAEDGGLRGHIFVAECKFWHGPKTLSDAIDQLLGYITWRDTKTAIIVFNRNKDFSAMLATVRETAMQHPNFDKEEASPRETEFRFVFHRSNDPSRHFKLAVLVFDMPAS
jgi:hypothetical protein